MVIFQRLCLATLILFTASLSAQNSHIFTQTAHVDSGEIALNLAVAADGTIHLANELDGLRAFTYDGTSFTHKTNINLPGSASSVALASDGTIYLANGTSGLTALTFDGTAYTNVTSSFVAGFGTGVGIGATGTIFLANGSDGLRSYEYNAPAFTQKAHIDSGGSAKSVSIGADGTIYVANGKDGLRVFWYDGNSFFHKAHIAPGDSAAGVAARADSTVFLANGDGGLIAYKYDGTTLTKKAEIDPGGRAVDVAIAADGTIFLANDSDGLRAFSYDGTAFTTLANTSPGGVARAIAFGPANTVYLASASQGLYAFEFEQGPPTQFGVSAIAQTQTAGTAFNVTITAQDVNGNTVTNYTGTAAISVGAGTVSPTVTNAFTAGVVTESITLTTRASGETLTFTDGNVTGTSNIFDVVAGALAQFSVTTISSPQTAGTPFDVTITAQDASGNTINGYTGTPTITAGTGTPDPAATQPFVLGTLTQSITLTTATSGEVLTFTDNATTGSSAAFDVKPAAADTFIVSAADGSALGNQLANVAFSIKAVAQDPYGNVDTSFVGTASLSDLTGTITPTTTDNFVAGVLASQAVTITQEQTADSINVSSGIITGLSNSFDVALGAVTKFSVAAITSPQIAGVPFDVTITAQDAGGNTITSYTGTADISAKTGTPAPTVTAAFVAGVATQSITMTTAATVEVLTFTDGNTTGSSGEFDVNAAAADTFIVTAGNGQPLGNQIVNIGFSIKIIAQDTFGNVDTGFTGTATLSDLSGTISPTTSVNFSAGTLASQAVIIAQVQTANAITASSGTITGSSNNFDVTVGTSVDNETGLHSPVTDYALDQNYPNPFNPTTRISYALVNAGSVKLSVFDTRGRELKVLVQAFQQAGRYTVNFDAGHIPSGVYFYKLQASSFTQMKKMILIR